VREKPDHYYRQSAVAPWRRHQGQLEVLLITSRSGKRWIIPKGIVEPELSPPESAAKEAWEEAGVRGVVASASLGTYRYRKWGGVCTVRVFPMHVTEVFDRWPECEERTRRWLTVGQAVYQTSVRPLKEILLRLDEALS
jgi:8-oxo-dGTP pyrophosphatase MutT (NUDIX family)